MIKELEYLNSGGIVRQGVFRFFMTKWSIEIEIDKSEPICEEYLKDRLREIVGKKGKILKIRCKDG